MSLAVFFLVVVVVRCWACQDGGGGPEFATPAKVALSPSGVGGDGLGGEEESCIEAIRGREGGPPAVGEAGGEAGEECDYSGS